MSSALANSDEIQTQVHASEGRHADYFIMEVLTMVYQIAVQQSRLCNSWILASPSNLCNEVMNHKPQPQVFTINLLLY